MIYAIQPYRQDDTWAFDDERLGVKGEPFVMGAEQIIDLLVAQTWVGQRFNLLFSAEVFVGWQNILRWQRAEDGGDWYALEDDPDMTGWLCPVLGKYFPAGAPTVLFVAVVPISGGS